MLLHWVGLDQPVSRYPGAATDHRAWRRDASWLRFSLEGIQHDARSFVAPDLPLTIATGEIELGLSFEVLWLYSVDALVSINSTIMVGDSSKYS